MPEKEKGRSAFTTDRAISPSAPPMPMTPEAAVPAPPPLAPRARPPVVPMAPPSMAPSAPPPIAPSTPPPVASSVVGVRGNEHVTINVAVQGTSDTVSVTGLGDELKIERKRHVSRSSHVVRGSVVMGLLVLAAGSVLFQASGFHYSAIAQTVIGTLGVLSGAVLGAREPV